MAVPHLASLPPVFTHQEYAAALARNGTTNPLTQRNLLHHHLRAGNLLTVRRGLYAVVPPGSPPLVAQVDPFLVASKLAPDAVVAYHSALELHGFAHSVFAALYFLTATRPRPLEFGGRHFQPVLVPKALRESRSAHFAATKVDRRGHDVAVTTLERTLVDALDRPDLAGGWEEIWRSLEASPYLDLDLVVDYALLLKNATTIARVGYYLDQHRSVLMVTDQHLERLRRAAPTRPVYFDPGRRPGRLCARWNLVVPPEVADRLWDEAEIDEEVAATS